MKTAEIFKLECNDTALSNVFIRIKDKRTPCGNYFFRLDKLNHISINDNSGLTALLEVAGVYIDPSVSYERFMTFMMQVFTDISESDIGIKIYELIVDEETVRDIPPRTRKTMTSNGWVI